MEALVINRKLYWQLFVYVSFLLFFFPSSSTAGVYLCCVLENHNENTFRKRTHLLCGRILWEATDWALAFHMYENKH